MHVSHSDCYSVQFSNSVAFEIAGIIELSQFQQQMVLLSSDRGDNCAQREREREREQLAGKREYTIMENSP